VSDRLTNILGVLDKVTSCNNIGMIFLDFAKAFDKVSPVKLQKLKTHGIESKL